MSQFFTSGSQSWHPTSNGTGLYGWSKKTCFLARLSYFSARTETSPLRQRAKFLVGESSCLAPFQAENTPIGSNFRAQNPKAKIVQGLPYNPVPLLAGPQYCLFDQLPLITTRLVCETRLPFSDRIQVSIPADVAPILMDYFRDKDREEFLIVLLNTANVITGLSQIRVSRISTRKCTLSVKSYA